MKHLLIFTLCIALSGCASYGIERAPNHITYVTAKGIPDPMFMGFKVKEACPNGAESVGAGQRPDGTAYYKVRCYNAKGVLE